MLELRYSGAWQSLSVVTLLIVLAAMLVPSDWLWFAESVTQFAIGDKWLHGLIFTVLAVWSCGQYARSSYWRVALGLLAFGLLIEIAQRAVSYRSAELFDLVADLVGIVAGLSLALAGAGGWTVRFEHWLQGQIG
jgi:VanZ family protein